MRLLFVPPGWRRPNRPQWVFEGDIRMMHRVAFSGSVVKRPSSMWRLCLRAAYLGLVFAPALLMLPFAFFTTTRHLFLRVLSAFCIPWAGGPVFLKGAQWISSRPDVFPLDVCLALGVFQHSAPQHPMWATMVAIEAARQNDAAQLGTRKTLEELIVGKTVLGSGCVAQVHRGTLPDGQVVAVKVLHAGVEDAIRIDLSLCDKVARVLEFVFQSTRYLDLRGTVDEFRRNLLAQIDMRVEFANLQRFRTQFANDSALRFPAPLFASESVLVMSYEPGVALSEVLASESSHPTVNRKLLAAVGMRMFMAMTFGHNFIHADLHPGDCVRVRGDDCRCSRC